MNRSNQHRPATARQEDPDGWLDLVRRQVANLRFGVVQIIVHDSRVVQVERTEKLRIATTQSNLNVDQATGGSMNQSGSLT